MKHLASLLATILLGASAHAQLPTRQEAVQIWKVSHPVSGSVATETRPGIATLEFPQGPIISKRNIDLPPTKIEGSWTRWTIDALITLKARTIRPSGTKPLARAGGSWKLFALLKDGRIIEARKKMYGTDLISYQSGGQIEQHYMANFALFTHLSTMRDVEAKLVAPPPIRMTGTMPGDKPILWRDVTELWLIDVPTVSGTTAAVLESSK